MFWIGTVTINYWIGGLKRRKGIEYTYLLESIA